MSKLDWEKQNRKETTDFDYQQEVIRHAQKRKTRQKQLSDKTTRLIKKEKALLAPYQSGIAEGENRERERIIKVLEECAQGNRKTVMVTPMLLAVIRKENNIDQHQEQ
jgi:hypothetical protein